MRYSRSLILTLLPLLLGIACSLPRFSAQEVHQQVIRVLDDRSEEELVLDYILVTPRFTPTPTFTPTLTPTLQAGSVGDSSPAGGTATTEPDEAASTPESAPTPATEPESSGAETPVASPVALLTATPLPSPVTPLPTASALPSATLLPTSLPSPTALPPTAPPPTSPPPTSPPSGGGGNNKPPTATPLPTIRVSFTGANFSVSERGNNVTIGVALSAPLAQTASVAYTSRDGSATAGLDYTGASGVLVFAPSQTSQTISIPILNDNLADEFNETVTLQLSNPTNIALGLATTTLAIVDDDPLIQFERATYRAGEGDGAMAITVVLNAVSVSPVRVNYRSGNGSATAGSDYSAVSGTLTIPSGLTANSFNLPIIDDAAIEADETIQLSLSNPANGTLGLAASTLTLEDNDLTVQFSSATYTILENGGTAAISVTLNGPSTRVVTVLYSTEDGTATAADYFTSAGVLTIPAGASGSSFTIPVIDEPLMEADETVILRLTAPVNARLGSASVATLTIVNDDTTPIVNTVDDGDDGGCDASHCSLREALAATNGSPGPDTITFNIPGGGPHTISPQSPLPTIVDSITLNGLSQPGASCSNPLIELEGGQAGAGTDGLALAGGSSVLQGLIINSFGGNGISVASSGNRLQCNSIFNNSGLGIDLAPPGLTPNDLGDSDSGANDLQNFPTLIDASVIGVNLQITGVFNGQPNQDYELEFFVSPSCDPAGHGEGEQLVDTLTDTTNGIGNFAFMIVTPGIAPAGQFVTATATDDNGNTSEFSACQLVN